MNAFSDMEHHEHIFQEEKPLKWIVLGILSEVIGYRVKKIAKKHRTCQQKKVVNISKYP